MRRFLCFLFDHDFGGASRARWNWCHRCRTNIYTGGPRGR